MEWQTIDTAPKDGTRVLLCTILADGTQYVVLGHWPVKPIFDQYDEKPAAIIEPRWCEGDHVPLWRQSTHWMPLPNPPTLG